MRFNDDSKRPKMTPVVIVPASISEEHALQTFSHDEEPSRDSPSPRARSRSVYESGWAPTRPLFPPLGTASHISDSTDLISRYESLPRLYGRSNMYVGRLNTQLLAAVKIGNVMEVQRLLDAGANPNATCHTEYISACHIAALHNNDILSILLRQGAERSRCDRLGRTPLHLAAWAGNLRAVSALLDLSEELQKKLGDGEVTTETEEEIVNLHNNSLKDIVDVRCVLGDLSMVVPKSWRDNLDHCCKEIDLPFLHPGWTPLHAAASSARHLCCRVLLAAGAEPCIRDLVGRTPLDVAGSSFVYGQQNKHFTEVIKILLTKSCKSGNFKKCIMLDTPLHTAVELENFEAIELLLEAGWSPRSLNRAGLTPLHLCVKKRLKQHLQTFLYNNSNDDQRQTRELVNVVNKDGYTVLHFAVLQNWLAGVCVALEARANIVIPANNGETPLHTAAAIGNLDILKEILNCAKSTNTIDILNQKGETALFKAILKGRLECVKLLLKEGASIKRTLPRKHNVFHVAAELGHLDILKVLLDHDYMFTREKVNVVTTEDRKGFGPIHFAVENNHTECVKLLLSKNTYISLKTAGGLHKESTPLHIATRKNSLEIAKIIIKFDATTVHNVDAMGWTPLHTAGYYASRDVIRLLIREGADLSACTIGPKKYQRTAIELIMNNLSKPTEFLESIFDMYIHRDTLSTNSEVGLQDTQVRVYYSILLPQKCTVKQKPCIKMTVIEALLKTGNRCGQRRLLIHPLVESFLCLKWKALLPFFYVMVFLYGLFAITLTIFTLSEYFYKDNKKDKPYGLNRTFWTYGLYVTIVVVLLQEIIFLSSSLKHYVLQKETWVKITSFILALILPIILEEYPHPSPSSIDWPRHIATMAILLCWLDLTILLSRFPNWGYYVLMFGKVFSNVVKILLTFAFLVIGFALSFMIQYHHQTPFDSPWAALVKTMVMMTSEFDYDDLVDEKNSKHLQLESLAMVRLIFFLFLILAAIVLMNLLVGVAVHDLHNLEVQGHIMRLEKQVEFLASLESLVFKRTIQRLLPPKLKYNLRLSSGLTKIVLSPCEPSWSYYKAIPAHVRDAIIEKAITQKKYEEHQISFESVRKQVNEIHETVMKVGEFSETQKRTADRVLQQSVVPSRLTDTDMIVVRMKKQVDDLNAKVDLMMDMMMKQQQQQINRNLE